MEEVTVVGSNSLISFRASNLLEVSKENNGAKGFDLSSLLSLTSTLEDARTAHSSFTPSAFVLE